VADQAGVEVQHVIQDTGAAAGLEEWLRANSTARIFIEKDDGMYDAWNRGLHRTDGELVAFLNSDEQYLPGTLETIAETFRTRPDVEIVVGDCLITSPAGDLLSFRRSTKLRPAMILTDHLYDLTCSMFFRRSIFDRGLLFDPEYKAAGDAEWVSRLLRNGVRVAYVREYLATFAVTGENLSLNSNRARELGLLRKITPRWAFFAAPLLRKIRHVEKFLLGGYRSRPVAYEIYASGDDAHRTRFACDRPSFRHPWA